jgi:predicted DCC family thiol-disulfide oxidoreductase YuxK
MAFHAHERATLIYDGQCPFCSRYVSLLDLRRSIDEISLVNAREAGSLVRELQEQGVNLDDGIVLILDGRIFYGADCINQIAVMGLSRGAFAVFNSWLFRSSVVANAFYPVLKFFRRATLRILGRKSIALDLSNKT